MDTRCVSCGAEVQRLLVQYSPGNIRLMKCQNCGEVADPYLECEFMILMIDLVLHKEKAYRHLLFNLLSRDSILRERVLWKSCLIYVICEICIQKYDKSFFSLFSHLSFNPEYLTFQDRAYLLSDKLDSTKGPVFSAIFCGEVFCGNIFFFGFLVLAHMLFPDQRNSWFLAIILSSYFNFFLASMMVWNFPPSALYIIDVLVISSNFVAIKVLKEMSSLSCFGVISGAHCVKFLSSAFLKILYSSLSG